MIRDGSVVATAALAAFAALSFYDGVVVHLFVERLPLRPASRLEHRIHTGRALLFPALLASFFGGRSPWIGLVLLALDQVLEGWDQWIERESRAHTGGLRAGEAVVHGVLTTLRAVAIVSTALIDRSRVSTASLDALVGLLIPGAVFLALAHVVLATEKGRSLLGGRSPAL